MNVTIRRFVVVGLGLPLLLAATLTFGVGAQQGPATPALHAVAPKRLIIRNAMVIYGSARPPYGPVDVVVEDGLIAFIGSASGRLSSGSDAVIDARGKYVMPGIVNTHMHWHEER